MSVFAFASASGAPGVSTSVLGFAFAWPRPVLLVEADPTGGSPVSAGWLHGEPPHDEGLVNLAMASDPLQELLKVRIPLPGSQVEVVAGLRSPAQAAAVSALWPDLAAAFAQLGAQGVDVLVDVGRLGHQHGPTAVVSAADVVLLATRPTLPAVAPTAVRAQELLAQLSAYGRAERLGLLLIGAPSSARPYPANQVAAATGLPVFAELPYDEKTAMAIHLGQDSRRLKSGPLAGAFRTGATQLVQRTNQVGGVPA